MDVCGSWEPLPNSIIEFSFGAGGRGQGQGCNWGFGLLNGKDSFVRRQLFDQGPCGTRE
jgi:hypothetical protein